MLPAKVAFKGRGHGGVTSDIKLTLVGDSDMEELGRLGLGSLRRKRIIRLTTEALEQGLSLAYKDLSVLLFTSISTLKRDVLILESQGKVVSLKGRSIKKSLKKELY